MTSLDKICDDLIRILAPKYQDLAPGSKDDTYIGSFLEKLRSCSDANSIRLLVSLGIDLNNYHKPEIQDHLADFIDIVRKVILNIRVMKRKPKSYPSDLVPPAIEFSLSLRDFTPHQLKPAVSIVEDKEYIRISNFNSYLRHVAAKNIYANPGLPANYDMKRSGRYYENLISGRRFTTINVCQLSSRNGWVFLACKTDLTAQLEKKNVELLLDNLGFYCQEIKSSDRYISFDYPPTFNELLFQPTSLTGDWGDADDSSIAVGNEFFLSYRLEDHWGRTFSVSGQDVRIKERVHLSLDFAGKKTYTFSVAPLGELLKPIRKANAMTILGEALDRYEKSK